MATWDKTSQARCKEVHPDLIAVVRRAFEISPRRCVVHEGRRTKERQAYLVSIRKSFTLDSRHLTGHAVDVYQLDEHGIVTWDHTRYEEFSGYMAQAATELQIPIEWRGNYTMKSGKIMKDGPHFQLPRRVYPLALIQCFWHLPSSSSASSHAPAETHPPAQRDLSPSPLLRS